MRTCHSPRAWAPLLACLALGCGSVDAIPHGAGGGGGAYEPFPPGCTAPDLQGPCEGDGKRCGDGKRDTCESCFSTDDGPVTCVDVTETCDGEPSATCAGLGYAAGHTLCGPACTHDVRDCDACLGAPHEVACARPRVDAFDVGDIVLASDGEAVAAAWISFDHILHFARFSADLALLGERAGCQQTPGVLPVALAPTPGGWVLALGGTGDAPQLTVQRLDLQGNELAPPRTVANASFPVLAARPGDTPLLVYARADFALAQAEIVAELLDEEAEPRWQTVLLDGAFGEETAAAFADPGFVVSARSAVGDAPPRSWLLPIDPSGAAGAPRELASAFSVAVAPAGPDRIAAVYRRDEAFELAWLDGQGASLGDPITVAARDATKATQEHAVIVSGDRAIVALAEATDTQLSLVHVDADGSIAAPRYALAHEPDKLAWLGAAPVGDGAAFVWTTYTSDPASSRFVLGRVRP